MRPSREELFTRLREIYGLTSDEQLGVRLGTSGRTVARWKAGTGPRSGPGYEQTIRLLAEAGYLSNGLSEPEEDEEIAALLVELEDSLARVLGQIQRIRVRQGPTKAAGENG